MSEPRRSVRIQEREIGKEKGGEREGKGKRKGRKGKEKEKETIQPQTASKKNRSKTTTAVLYLRIARRFLNLLPAPTDDQPNPQPLAPLPGTAGVLNAIVVPLSDLYPFSGNTVDWLIRIARLIFQPLGMSSLYTFTTGSVQSWLNREMVEEEWRMVQFGEELMPTIYEFRPDSLITPTRISTRQARSMTTTNSANRSTPFRDILLQRHNQCVISTEQIHDNLVASHLIPRRLGDSGVQSAIRDFTNIPPTTVNIFSPIIGVPLFTTLDTFVDSFQLGFWSCGPVSYS
jgi:hypothetical protein